MENNFENNVQQNTVPTFEAPETTSVAVTSPTPVTASVPTPPSYPNTTPTVNPYIIPAQANVVSPEINTPKTKSKKKLIPILAVILVLVIAAVAITFFTVIKPTMKYNEAVDLMHSKKYEDAIEIFSELDGYKDSETKINECNYEIAVKLMDDEKFEEAIEIFTELGEYKDCKTKINECNYAIANELMDDKKYEEAREIFLSLGEHGESEQMAITAAQYMLVDYLDGKEVDIETINEYSATGIQYEDGILYMAYMFMSESPIEVNLIVGTAITPGETDALFFGSDKLSSYAAYYEAEAEIHIDLTTYKSGDTITWEDFSVTGRTAQGTRYTQSETLLDAAPTSAMTNITQHLESLLEESGLGLTMADIGFSSY